MRTTLSYAGWIIALTALTATAMLYAKTNSLQNALAKSRDAIKEGEVRIAALTAESQQLAQKSKSAEDQLAKANETVSALKAKEKESSAEKSAPAPQPASDADTKAQPAKPTAEEESMQRKVATAQMGAMTDMQYAKLYAQLNLPEDQKAALRDRLIDANLKIQDLTASAMKAGDMPAKEYTRQKNDIEDKLRDDLSKSLTAAQMAAWDAYAPIKDQNQYETLLDGQLTMLSPGLDAENRASAKTVFAEELALALTDFGNTDKPFTLSNFNDAQMAALRQGLQRMAPTLSEEQYAHLDGFVNRVAEAFAAMSGKPSKK